MPRLSDTASRPPGQLFPAGRPLARSSAATPHTTSRTQARAASTPTTPFASCRGLASSTVPTTRPLPCRLGVDLDHKLAHATPGLPASSRATTRAATTEAPIARALCPAGGPLATATCSTGGKASTRPMPAPLAGGAGRLQPRPRQAPPPTRRHYRDHRRSGGREGRVGKNQGFAFAARGSILRTG